MRFLLTFRYLIFSPLVVLALSGCGIFKLTSLDKTQPSNQDPGASSSFGKNGLVAWNLGRDSDSSDYAAGMLLTDDERIWLFGSSSLDNGPSAFVVSYEADGSLDSTFGYQSGKAVMIPASTILDTSSARKMIQSGEYIYLVGDIAIGDGDFYVARMNRDGTFDLNFHETGIFTYDFIGSPEAAVDMQIQEDGKVLVFGQSDSSFAVLRLNVDGTLDNTFDGDGVAVNKMDAISPSDDFQFKMLLQNVNNEEKIVLIGNTTTGGPRSLALMRLNSDGSLDTSFGINGKVTAALGGNQLQRIEAAVLGDSSILIAGNNSDDVVLAKFTEAGVLDTNFNVTGYLVQDFTADEEAVNSLAIQADGKIVIAGVAGTFFTHPYAFIARFDTTGALDPGFDSDGYKTYELVTGQDSMIVAIRALPAGGFFVYGSTHDGVSSIDSTVLQKLTSSGAIDTSFHSGDGQVVVNVGNAIRESIRGYQILANGKIVVMGGILNSSNLAELTQLNADGSVNTEFGVDGTVTYPIGSGSNQAFQMVVEQSDKKIIALLTYHDGTFRQTQLVRYTPEGVLDTTFNLTGSMQIEFPYQNSEGYFVSVDSDDRLYVSGTSYDNAFGSDTRMAIVRLNKDGGYDSSFATGGKWEWDPTSYNDSISRIEVLPSGKILAVGASYDFAGVAVAKLYVLRFNDNGSLDNTFASGGVYTGQPMGTDPDKLYYFLSYAFSGGKITLLTSYSDIMTGDSKIFSIQLNEDGSLNTSFGVNGLVEYNYALDTYVTGARLESDGKAVFSILQEDLDGKVKAEIYHHKADGTIDNTIHGGQPLEFTIPAYSFTDLFGLEKTADGNYLIGGTSNFAASDHFFLLRFTENGVE